MALSFRNSFRRLWLFEIWNFNWWRQHIYHGTATNRDVPGWNINRYKISAWMVCQWKRFWCKHEIGFWRSRENELAFQLMDSSSKRMPGHRWVYYGAMRTSVFLNKKNMRLRCLEKRPIVWKIIMQYIWNSDFGWDNELTIFCEWRCDLSNIHRARVQRCYSGAFSSATIVQLHIFGDALEQTYCTTSNQAESSCRATRAENRSFIYKLKFVLIFFYYEI